MYLFSKYNTVVEADLMKGKGLFIQMIHYTIAQL